ncbi:hypothetical protein [Embleya hyalina]|uniref:Uncharacterized protein n=1 Tax=Embleya hyalina TaxID=516124 RepID=A0A401YVB9_9ACTN|nr:hypothetical protein [Embleya hyalina]GCD98568.1 hypothetical protein EHYA_06279 [Embleya hyalina]
MVHSTSLRAVVAFGMAIVLGGCTSASESVCTADWRVPVTIDIAPELADRVTDIRIRLCRAGSCQEPRVTLPPARDGSARVGRILDVDLTAEPMEATVRVSTVSPDATRDSRLTVTPRTTGRGTNCRDEHDARLVVAADAGVTQA